MLQKFLVCFQWVLSSRGGSMQHGRDMIEDSNNVNPAPAGVGAAAVPARDQLLGQDPDADLIKVTAEFSAWAKANNCTDAAFEQALVEAKHQYPRVRLLRAEFWHHWIRAIARSRRGIWRWREAKDKLGADRPTIFRALRVRKPTPPPPLTKERIRKMLVYSLAIAEKGGNQPAIEFLRQQLKQLES
jgi:hypothetical protein